MGVVGVHKHKALEKVLIDRLRVLGPIDDRRITDLLYMFAVCQQCIQCGGIRKGGRFAHRCVVALGFSVGFKGRCIEGDKRCPAGLGALHPLDGWMQSCNGNLSACDEAAPFFLAVFFSLSSVPNPGDFRFFMDKSSLIPKNQVCPRKDFFQIGLKRWVFPRCSRFPVCKVGAHRTRCRMVERLQHFAMQFRARLKTFLGAFIVSLSIHSEEIARVVTKEICFDPHCSRHRLGQLHNPGNLHFLLSPQFLLLQPEDIQKRPLLINEQGKRDLGGAPSPPCHLPLGSHRGIVFI